MANFDTPARTDLPVDYTNNSQGPRADRNDALGNLFKDVAGVADAGIKEADRQKRQDIETDILEQTEAIQEEFGVGSATDTEVDAESGGDAARPAALSRAYENLDHLQNAYAKGALKESHYWARLNVMVRQLRAKYPGYVNDIDSMVSSVVGSRPANALRSSLFSEWNEAANAKANDPLGKLEDWGVKEGMLPPDYFQRQQEGNPYNLVELQSYISGKTQAKVAMEARKNEMSLLASQNSLDKQTAEINFREDATTFVHEILFDASKVLGKNFQEGRAKIVEAQRKIAAGMPVDTVELTQMFGTLGEIRMEAELALNQQFLASWDGNPSHSYSSLLDKTTQDAIVQQALGPIDTLMTSFAGTNNPYAVVAATTAYLEASKSSAARKLLQEVPLLENLGALTQLAGPDATALLLQVDPKLNNALTTALLNFSTTNGALGQGVVGDALDKGEQGNQKADYYLGLTESWTNIARSIDSGTIPVEVIQNQVKYMFGQDSTAVLSKMTPESRVMWYTKVASPEVTIKMQKLRDMGDTESWNLYQDWVKGAFVNIFAQEMNGLNAPENMYGELQSIQWDPATTSFKFATPEGVTPFAGMLMAGQVSKPMQNLNAAIQVIKPILDDQQGEIEKELTVLIAAMGFNGVIPEAMLEELQANVEIGENPNPDDE